MKITKRDLYFIFNSAHDNYTKNTNNGLTEQEFRTKCYIDAFARYFELEDRIEYEERIPYIPPED